MPVSMSGWIATYIYFPLQIKQGRGIDTYIYDQVFDRERTS